MSTAICEKWFKRFKNNMISITFWLSRRNNKLKLLPKENLAQTLKEHGINESTISCRLKTIGKIQKKRWFLHFLCKRECERLPSVSYSLLDIKKIFVTNSYGYWKMNLFWYFWRSWIDPIDIHNKTQHPQQLIYSHIFLCIWWNQEEMVYYEIFSYKNISPFLHLSIFSPFLAYF